MASIRYSPSVNIIRDKNKSLHYIPTSNTMRIYDQISESYSNSNIRSFNLVGSYGTGKSAFLLAFEKHASNQQQIFRKRNGEFKGIADFCFMNFVGDYSSLIDVFAKRLKLRGDYTPDDVIRSFHKYYEKNYSDSSCLVLVFDEFGKHLEFAVLNEPEKEMYFIQLLAEYVNDENKNIIFLTTLHQNIDAYGTTLDVSQKQEWNKVRGRLKEIPFVEPVEQLISLAAEHITNKKIQKHIPDNFDNLLKVINNTNLLPLQSKIDKELAYKLYPMDILSSAILTLALQKYGQNERSLFSFLLTNDYLGINDYDFKKNDYYNLSAVYDYLLNNYYTFLFTKDNPHYTQWAAIRSSIERVEGLFDNEINEICKIVKTIGLLNIFSPEASVLDKQFLVKYGSLALQITNIDEILHQLEVKKIIKYVLYKKKYILFEGSDLDIELALKDAGNKVDENFDIKALLHQYFEFPYLAAKKVHYEKGTPRFFEFQLTDEPIKKNTKKVSDGIINLILPESIENAILSIKTEKNNDACLYGIYTNIESIKKNIFDLIKIQYVIETVHDDIVARRELENLLIYNINSLNTFIFRSFYNGNIRWFYNGNECSINNHSELSRVLSNIIEDVYCNAPTFKNELINRDKLPSAITVARKALFKAMLTYYDKKHLNIPKDKYPPEKMIYNTLLLETGIHAKVDNQWTLYQPNQDNDFLYIWNESIDFLKSTKSRRRPLTDLLKILSAKPYGLKRGLIDFWIPIFLFSKRDEFAIYLEDRYVPNIDEELMELFVKSPKKIEIKAFNVNGIKYEMFQKYQTLIKRGKQEVSNKSFVSTIKPLLHFYKQLPEYTKKTKNLKPHTKKFRDAIAKAKDPEKTFFDDIPNALGFANLDFINSDTALQKYIDTIQDSINELKFSYDSIIELFEDVILEILGYKKDNFEKVLEKIKKRYSVVHIDRCTAFQKSFLQRLMMSYDTKAAWISSIVYAVLNKSLTNITDDEVVVASERVKDALIELEDLSDLSKVVTNDDFTNVYKVSLSSFGNKNKSKIVRITTKQKEKIELESDKIRQLLTKDKNKNIEILSYLLEEEFNK